MTQSGTRFALRDLTRSGHDRLDALVGEFNVTGDYTRYLDGMAAFRGSVEAALANVDHAGSFETWRPGLIVPELAMDLRDLGLQAPRENPAFDVPPDPEGLLGVFYVLEGSALGARLLASRAAALGFSADYGARHLAAQTSRPGAWPHLVSLLGGLSATGLERAAFAARMTFSAAIVAFSRMDHRERAC